MLTIFGDRGGEARGTRLEYGTREADAVKHRLKCLIAVFFVVQIVLPFTAPLHVCDFNDLFNAAASHEEPGSQQSHPLWPTPAKEAEPETDAFVSPLAAATLSASVALVVASGRGAGRLPIAIVDAASSPHVQQTVLKL